MREPPLRGVEAVAGDIDLNGEARRQENFGVRPRRGHDQHERYQGDEPSSHVSVMLQ